MLLQVQYLVIDLSSIYSISPSITDFNQFYYNNIQPHPHPQAHTHIHHRKHNSNHIPLATNILYNLHPPLPSTTTIHYYHSQPLLSQPPLLNFLKLLRNIRGLAKMPHILNLVLLSLFTMAFGSNLIATLHFDQIVIMR